MDYQKHYDRLVERAQNRILEGYIERHHIVPQCMGGNSNPSNLVDLTPEEHYVAHQLLVKIYPENRQLIHAANMMSVSSKSQQRSNKRYGWLRKKHAEACKQRTGSKNPSYGRKWYYDPLTGTSGKFADTEVPEGWIKGRIIKGRTNSAKNYSKVCKGCSGKFESATPNRSYCSDKCKPSKSEITALVYKNRSESDELARRKKISNTLKQKAQCRPQRPKVYSNSCVRCESVFESKTKERKYCSQVCRNAKRAQQHEQSPIS